MSIDVSQFLAVFFEESSEGLQNMEAGLLDMQPGNVDEETLNSVFRAAHSIKGGAATFGLGEIADFTHTMETLLGGMRAGTRTLTAESRQMLLASVGCLRDMLLARQHDTVVDEAAVALQQRRLQQLLSGQQCGDSPSAAARTGADSPAGGSIRVSIQKIDSLMNIVRELVITQSMLSQFGNELDKGSLEKLHNGLAQLARNTRELQEGVMGIRMLPIGHQNRDRSDTSGERSQ